MIQFEKYKTNKPDSSYAVCATESIYPAKLMMVRVSKEAEQFVEQGKEPRDQVSFVFDVKNADGQSVHVASKPTSVSFGDKSNLPKFWGNVKELKSADDLNKLLYPDDKLADIYCNVYVSVTKKEDKVFNTVSKVVGVIDKFDMKWEQLYTNYDLNVYGKPCEEFDVAEGYELLK